MTRGIAARVAFVWLVVCALGCESGLTEIIVIDDSTLDVPAELDEIVVTTQGTSGQPQGASARLATSSTLPVTVGLRPGVDQDGPFAIHIRGRRAGVERVSAHITTRFITGARLVLRVQLTDDCVGILCDDGETCRRGLCASDFVDPATLASFAGTLPGRVDDAGVNDAGQADAARPDGSLGCLSGAACDDGNACNGVETCDAGVCLAGTPLRCDDGVACTVDTCGAAGCTHTPSDVSCTAAAGGRCDAATGCQYATCTSATCSSDGCTAASCSGDTCLRTSSCAAGTMCCAGACVAAGCDDGNPCTADSCGGSGCANAADTSAACSDGNVCTTGDSCSAAGSCVGGNPVSCDDGNPCTDDTCAAGGGCAFVPNNAACDDGSACTSADACAAGACAGGARLSCDDGNPCTTDGCNPSTGCVFPPFSGSCDDGNPCTTGEMCVLGLCGGGSATVCPATVDFCRRSVCLATTGCTTEDAVGARCDDLDECTRADRCQVGAYCEGTPLTGCIPR